MKNLNKLLTLAIILGLGVFLTPDAMAQTTIASMFANGTKTWIAAQKLVVFFGYIMGAYLIVGAPIAMFFVGIFLFTLMGMLEAVTVTMSMGSGPGSALIGQVSGSGTMAAAITGVLTFIRLIGYIAFVRGWLMLNQTAQGKDGVMGRALTHILGGVAAINVKTTAYMLAATFAPGIPISTFLG
jgi:hypothetical protein